MNILITGPNQCGKSKLAERLLQETGRPLGYIGTLPKEVGYRQRIENHQSRRGPEWQLIEISGTWDEDRKRIKKLHEEGRIILIDGLSVMFWRTMGCAFRDDWHRDGHELSRSFLKLIKDLKSDCVIVDSETAYPSTNDARMFNEMLWNIHKQLVAHCGVIHTKVDRNGLIKYL